MYRSYGYQRFLFIRDALVFVTRFAQTLVWVGFECACDPLPPFGDKSFWEQLSSLNSWHRVWVDCDRGRGRGRAQADALVCTVCALLLVPYLWLLKIGDSSPLWTICWPCLDFNTSILFEHRFYAIYSYSLSIYCIHSKDLTFYWSLSLFCILLTFDNQNMRWIFENFIYFGFTPNINAFDWNEEKFAFDPSFTYLLSCYQVIKYLKSYEGFHYRNFSKVIKS